MSGAVVVVGDVMVDVVAVPEGPIARGTDTPSQVQTTGGGSAANTACWLAQLGAPVRLVAAVGDDELGRSARSALDELGVEFAGQVDGKVPTGICVVLIDDTGERTMLPDRGANEELSPALVEAAIDPDVAWVHVSGYALLGAGSRPAAQAAIAAARRLGVPWSVDAASAAPLGAAGATRFLQWIDGCTVLFANEDELAVLGGTHAALARADEVVLKLGPAGARWTDGTGSASSPAAPATVVDTIGAGDAFAAGFLAARLQGSDPAASLHGGAGAAAQAVSQRGGASMTEVWATGISLPGVAVRMAQRAEADGFDGWFVVDSQNLAGDCYVALAQAAAATERIQLGTGVTNPYTRHPAVTASAIASVHAASGGRAVLGIGRGDSALAHLGLAPAPVALFERYLAQVQAYLRGDEVAFDDLGSEVVAEVGTLGLAGQPTSSRLHWLPPDLPKVPMTVAATGPKVIDAAARTADRITFALGADPERLGWGIERARAVRPDLALGAFVNVVCHDDVDTARALASGGMSTFARFNVMHGTTHGPMGDESRDLLQEVHDAYDMRAHTQSGSPQAERLTAPFADSFAVLGPADQCVARLQALTELGLDHLVIVGPSLGADPTEARLAYQRFVADVLPALHP